MAYNPGIATESPVGGVEVLFGGLAPWGATNYTYVGVPSTVPLPDGSPTASILWVNISSYVRAPSPRYYAAMTYDAADGYVLLFGGQYGGVNQTLGDTWTLSVTYQGETINPPPQPATFKFDIAGWTKLPDRTGPSPRTGAALTFDPLDNYSVLFGGIDAPTFFGDTWTFSAGSWTELHPARSPSARAYAGFVFDQAAGYAILLTGYGSGPDAWGFMHGSWVELSPSTPLGARFDESIAYDNVSGVATAFGGVNASNFSAVYGTTWNYSSLPGWYKVDSYGPVARAASAMAYDPQIGCVVLFGGGTSSSSGWLNDTWLLCSWSESVAPFTATLVSDTEVSDRPEVQAGGNATFTVVPSGGTWPYYLTLDEYDSGYGPPVAQDELTPDGPINVTFTFPISANYLIFLYAEDSYGSGAEENLTFPVGTLMVDDWQPLFDSYAFHNYGSAWSAIGNCYGFSSTMVLYWEHDVEDLADTPYLPAPVWDTEELAEPPGLPHYPGPGLNGTTLAIMIHQTMGGGGAGTGFAPSDFATGYARILANLSAGQPEVMFLTNSTKAGAVGHAVVVYGEETLPNGSVDLDVSDPNGPLTTETALYDPAAETFSLENFWYYFEAYTSEKIASLQPSWFTTWTQGNSNEYDTQGGGYYLVGGLAPLTVSLAGGGNDSFSDGGSLGDSQTFVQGIANSTGIEEASLVGTTQVFALENLSGRHYSVTDPSSGASPVEVLLATNVSGMPTVRGYDLNFSSAGQHDFTLGLGSGGRRCMWEARPET